MKIFKLGQDSGGGDGGKVIVKLITNKKDGTFKMEVMGHADGASCADELDHSILDDLMNAEVEGFGKGIMTGTHVENTEEFYENSARKGTPMVAKPFEEEEEEAMLTTPAKHKDLGLGYNV